MRDEERPSSEDRYSNSERIPMRTFGGETDSDEEDDEEERGKLKTSPLIKEKSFATIVKYLETREVSGMEIQDQIQAGELI